MTRETLPNRRSADTFEMVARDMIFIVSFGRSPIDNRVIEVFASCSVGSSNLDVDLCDSCVAVSLALQHGASVSDIRKSMLRARNGRPAGLLGAVLDEVELRSMVIDGEGAA